MQPASHNLRRQRLLLLAVPLGLMLVGLLAEPARRFAALRFAAQRTADAMPSSTAVPASEVARGFPLMSVYIEPRDLSDPRTGLWPNKLKRGQDWEKPATVSYFDGGRLLFASGVGIRVHGDLSRRISPVLSYRLYFRRQYGAEEFKPGLLFDRTSDPLHHIVLHNDLFWDGHSMYWHFIDPLAYDISHAIGCITVQTKPVRFFLDGKFQGVYVATEHISSAFFQSHFGHSDFNQSNRAYDELYREITNEHPLTMATVAQVVDLENLTRWYLSVLFCATDDTYQGAQLRDETREGSRWFWINWDMDHSFLDFDGRAAVPWEHDTFRLMMERIAERRRGRQDNEVRAYILTTLFAEDPDYREYFKKLFDEVMNYKITPAFLDERFEHYADIARTYGVDDTRYLTGLREFLTRRPAILRRMAEEYLNTRPSVRLTLAGMRQAPLRVEGFAVPQSFSGFYFPDRSIQISVDEAERPLFAYWLVNGQRQGSSPILTVRTSSDLTIKAVFRQESTLSTTRGITGPGPEASTH
jgi:hypothetical protein